MDAAGSKKYGTEQAVLGVTVCAHFGNQLRTLGYVVAHIKQKISWNGIKKALQATYEDFGSVHSSNCMSGSGFPTTGTPDYFQKFSNGFRSVYQHKSFADACKLLQKGVCTHEQYEALYKCFEEVQKRIRGSFPLYHFKLALDHQLPLGGFILRLLRNGRLL